MAKVGKKDNYAIRVCDHKGSFKGWANRRYSRIQLLHAPEKGMTLEKAKQLLSRIKQQNPDWNLSYGKFSFEITYDKVDDGYSQQVDRGIELYNKIYKAKNFLSLEIDTCVSIVDEVTDDHSWLCRRNGNLNMKAFRNLENPITVNDYILVNDIDRIAIMMINPQVKFYKID